VASADWTKITYVGGPTALVEFRGIRFLTDPAFDPAGGDYTTGPVTLHKIQGPALNPEKLGSVDAVLLSHDHHFDNLDYEGRNFLQHARRVFTTQEGASRLGGNAEGLADWQTVQLSSPNGPIAITATPARHGPAGKDRGPVIGFVLEAEATQDPKDARRGAVYISGDTVWYEGTAAVAGRFDVRTAILFMGAARVPAVGPDHLTMTAAEGIEAARAFPNAVIVPLHFEGWAHFSESRDQIQGTFAAAGMAERLQWLEPGITLDF
jgi:L-ascorbate metabolism protein UlaG (beta-lactamase superfamily)